ncbi:DnaJ (Hsp40), sub C, member 17 [Mortierella sp. AM989]|nr:DnaJ (Hsp40), sub C, member 17 [Mortierella sp. AM989]
MTEEQKDWYNVLGVERTATAKEVTKAYRLKALKYHPDKNPDPNAGKIFHDLTQAYELLLDPAARAAFDNLLNVKVQAQVRANKYDSARRKMKEDLENRENAFRKQQQEEKLAASRMAYEMERLKNENIKKRAEREAELLREADQLADAAAEAKLAARDGKSTQHPFPILRLGSSQVANIMYVAMKAFEREDKDLEAFTIAWAAGVEPMVISTMRAKEDSSLPKSASPSGSGSPPSSAAKSIPQPAFNVATSAAFTPAFSTPAFTGFSSQIPSFSSPPAFGTAAPFVDDYEAATLAKMKSKDNERKRLAEEIMRRDQEEEERLQSSREDKKRKEKARQAAGQMFLTPLTNAIAEQRLLVDSFAQVSKVRVEECKHMMEWSKSQPEDLGDVLLKLNLLIRKISDYELRFGTQYVKFREQIKVLRTKDDALCDLGRVQSDLLESSKIQFRTAKKKFLQRESDIAKYEDEQESKEHQRYKRNLIKEAYTYQMDSIIELGRKMQIIGEHGKKLLDHIDVSCTGGAYDDGRETEDILQAARIALENWDQVVEVTAQSVVIHPASAVSRSEVVAKSPASAAVNGTGGSTSLKTKPSVTPTFTPPLPPRSSMGTPVMSKPEQRKSHDDDQEQRDIELAIQRSLADKQNEGHSTEGEEDHDLVAAKMAALPRVARGPQAVDLDDHATSQLGPRQWVSTKKPKNKEASPRVSVEEELGNSSLTIAETMGEYSPEVLPNTKSAKSNQDALKSTNRGEDYPLESMGSESAVPLESMGQDGCEYQATYTPSMFSRNDNPRQKIQTSHLQQKGQQQPSPCPPSAELQYLSVQDSPQLPHQSFSQPSSPYYVSSSFSLSVIPAPPVGAMGYKPATQYVPQAVRQKNRLSGVITPPLNEGSLQSSKLADQKAYQLKHQQSYQQTYQDKYAQLPSSNLQKQQRSLREQQHFQQQQNRQLQDFYNYTQNEQERWSHDQGLDSSHPQNTASNLSYPVSNMGADYQYKEERYVGSHYSNGPSPTPSHVSHMSNNSTPSSPNYNQTH